MDKKYEQDDILFINSDTSNYTSVTMKDRTFWCSCHCGYTWHEMSNE